jgi:hypothetical protein
VHRGLIGGGETYSKPFTICIYACAAVKARETFGPPLQVRYEPRVTPALVCKVLQLTSKGKDKECPRALSPGRDFPACHPDLRLADCKLTLICGPPFDLSLACLLGKDPSPLWEAMSHIRTRPYF